MIPVSVVEATCSSPGWAHVLAFAYRHGAWTCAFGQLEQAFATGDAAASGGAHYEDTDSTSRDSQGKGRFLGREALKQLIHDCLFGGREQLEPRHMLTRLAQQNVGGVPDLESVNQSEIA